MYFLFSVIDRFAVQEDTSAARERGTGAREERDSYAWLPWRPAALNHGARGAYFLIITSYPVLLTCLIIPAHSPLSHVMLQAIKSYV